MFCVLSVTYYKRQSVRSITENESGGMNKGERYSRVECVEFE